VGHINVGKFDGIREDGNGGLKNWGTHRNLNPRGWAFGHFISILEYKAKIEGIEVAEVSERNTSLTTCPADSNRRHKR